MKKLIALGFVLAAVFTAAAEDLQQSCFDILFAENSLYLKIHHALIEDKMDRVKYLLPLLPHTSYRVLQCYTAGGDAKLSDEAKIFDDYNRQYRQFLAANPDLFPADNRVMLHTMMYLEKFTPESERPAASLWRQKVPANELKEAGTAWEAIAADCRESVLSNRDRYLLSAMLLQNYQNFLALLPLLKSGDRQLLQAMVFNSIVLNQHELDNILRLRPDLAKGEYQKYLTELKNELDPPGVPSQGSQP